MSNMSCQIFQTVVREEALFVLELNSTKRLVYVVNRMFLVYYNLSLDFVVLAVISNQMGQEPRAVRQSVIV